MADPEDLQKAADAIRSIRGTAREYTNGNVVYDLYYNPNKEQARRIPSRYAGAAEPGESGGEPTALDQSIRSDRSRCRRPGDFFGRGGQVVSE